MHATDRIIRPSLALLCLCYSSAAWAVCLAPVSGAPGYRMALAEEVRAADAIVIGQVRSLRALQEDPGDSAGVTAHEVTVEVLTRLKGAPSRLISFRNENTSSRYPVSVGEKHLLFFSRARDQRYVNSCGHSARLPGHGRLPGQLELELQRQLHQPATGTGDAPD